jgi:plasmid stabilization system protein ParE
MKRRTFVSPAAQNDIRDAARWYEDREVGLGLRFLSEVRGSLKRIAADRLTFPIVDEDVRRTLLHKFPYSIYFVGEREAVSVIAVLNQHRQPGMWKSRRERSSASADD